MSTKPRNGRKPKSRPTSKRMSLKEQLKAERIRRLRIESEMLAALEHLRDELRQSETLRAELLDAADDAHRLELEVVRGERDRACEAHDAAETEAQEERTKAERLQAELHNAGEMNPAEIAQAMAGPALAPESDLAFLTALPTETPDPDEDEKRRALLARTRALARDWPATGKWTDLPPTEMECHALRAAILGAPAREDAAPGYAREVRP